MKVPMKVPMKVQLGIMAMIDIATNSQGGRVVTTTSISKRQNISPKYLEQILPALRLAMLIRSQKGSNGGYIITKPCNQITLKDIINALDPNILSDVYFDTNNKNSTMIDTINDDLWTKEDLSTRIEIGLNQAKKGIGEPAEKVFNELLKDL